MRDVLYKKMFEEREKGPYYRNDTGRMLWFSMGKYHIFKQNGVKFCNWFCFRHNGFFWHTKGVNWVKNFDCYKYDATPPLQAVAKGCPDKHYKRYENAVFCGIPVNIPRLPGTLCDFWDPGWSEISGSQSAKKYILIIKKWEEKSKWRTVRA